MNEIALLHHEDFGNLEVRMINGIPHVPASACAKILGYSNPRKAVLDHCDDVVKCDGVSHTTNQHGITTAQTVSTNYIPESDVYGLILSSKLPTARKFGRWLCREVLPSIHKYGCYPPPASMSREDELAMLCRSYLAYQESIAEQNKQ